MFRCITHRKVDTQIYSKTSMFIPLAYQRESLNFIEWSIEGLARLNFIRLYIPLYGLFGVLYNILKGWRRRRNVSCGSVANIRVRSVIVEGTNTLEES